MSKDQSSSCKCDLISSARHSSIHCVQAHTDKHSKENIFLSYCIELASPTAFGNALEINFWKIFSVLFSPSGYADCAKCAVNEACGIPYVLLMKTDLISTFSCHSELFECRGVVLLSLKRAPSPPAFLHVKSCTANDSTCLCRVTHPKLLYHQPLAFSALSALNLALYHLSLGISYQFFKEIASIGIFSRH